MGNTLEFSVLFVCLSFSVPPGTEKIAGLWFARVVSTQAGTVVYIYIGFPTVKDGGRPLPQAENLLISPHLGNSPQ